MIVCGEMRGKVIHKEHEDPRSEGRSCPLSVSILYFVRKKAPHSSGRRDFSYSSISEISGKREGRLDSSYFDAVLGEGCNRFIRSTLVGDQQIDLRNREDQY